VWLETRSRNLLDEPAIEWLVVYTRGITDRKELGRELTKFETIVETISHGIYVLDDDGRFTMVNDALVEVTGYTRDELLGSTASLVVDGDGALDGIATVRSSAQGRSGAAERALCRARQREKSQAASSRIV
jgi:PAS domain-containing protein